MIRDVNATTSLYKPDKKKIIFASGNQHSEQEITRIATVFFSSWHSLTTNELNELHLAAV